MKCFTVYSLDLNKKIFQQNSNEIKLINNIDDIIYKLNKNIPILQIKEGEKIPIKLKSGNKWFLLRFNELVYCVYTSINFKERKAFEFLIEIYPNFKIKFNNTNDLIHLINKKFKIFNEINYLLSKSDNLSTNIYKSNIINEVNDQIALNSFIIKYDENDNSKLYIYNNKSYIILPCILYFSFMIVFIILIIIYIYN